MHQAQSGGIRLIPMAACVLRVTEPVGFVSCHGGGLRA